MSDLAEIRKEIALSRRTKTKSESPTLPSHSFPLPTVEKRERLKCFLLLAKYQRKLTFSTTGLFTIARNSEKLFV